MDQNAESVLENATGTPPPTDHHSARLSIKTKTLILQFLEQRSEYGALKYGALTEASLHFGYHRHTIEMLWKRKKGCISSNEAFNLETKWKGNVGRKWVPFLPEQISSIPCRKRTTYRDLGAQLDRSDSTMHMHKRKGEIRAHSNALKPGLTEANKRRRVKYCIDLIELETLHVQPKFKDMRNIVHIDEKWFLLTRKNLHMYLAPKEKGPHRSCKSKNFIPKVMFMSAVARPRTNTNGAFTFPGKIGIWPFTYKYVAKKSSVNRPRGIVETKTITKVDKHVFRKMMTENVIPAIKEKWPREEGHTTIFIQADNAKPHGGADIHQFIESHSDENFTFKWAPQATNSPDLNTLDLGLFNHLQSKYQKTMPETIDKMVEEVGKAYEDQHPKIISNVWHSLQYCMGEMIGCLGRDDYELPHVKKQQLEDARNLPWQVEPNKEKVEAAIEYYNQPEVARAALRSDMQATIEEGYESDWSQDSDYGM